MSARQDALVTLAMSSVFVGYIYYVLVPVPAGVEQPDRVFWILAATKFKQALSILGEFLGVGPRFSNLRSLQPLFDVPILPRNDLQIVKANFNGIDVRLHQPSSAAGLYDGPALVYFHDGGWTLPSTDAEIDFVSELSRRLGVCIVDVDYRLAPEHKFPAALEDCMTASIYFFTNALRYGVNPDRIAIAGSGSGGNLAVAVARRLRQLNFQPEFQVLIYPALQPIDFGTPSYQQHGDNSALSRYWMVYFWLWYSLGTRTDNQLWWALYHNRHVPKGIYNPKLIDHTLVQKFKTPSYEPSRGTEQSEELWNEVKDTFLNSSFAPLVENKLDIQQIPTTYIVTIANDVLRDDGIIYAKRLERAGVRVHHKHYETSFHGGMLHWRMFNASAVMLNDLVMFLGINL